MALEIGREVAEHAAGRALRAIGWTIQRPRPRHSQEATHEEQADSKKNSRNSRRRGAAYPGAVIEVFATDEHRIGLKPILRRAGRRAASARSPPGINRFPMALRPRALRLALQPARGLWYLSTR